jgi:hypothetical protein
MEMDAWRKYEQTDTNLSLKLYQTYPMFFRIIHGDRTSMSAHSDMIQMQLIDKAEKVVPKTNVSTSWFYKRWLA